MEISNSNSMLKLSFISVNIYELCIKLFLLLLVLPCSQFVASGSPVKFLPGFQGPLPFEFETGFVGVDESDDVQLFYYFVKSERNPKEDPLMLWITGGPGCSSFTGLVFEIGPLYFESVEYNGTLPTLVLNPNSWTKVASIIFVDLPVGSGFSYARTSLAFQSNDLKLSGQAYQFLRKWLIDHPEFNSNPFYVGGDSYSGIPIPIIADLISNGNEAGFEQFINLKGYVLGNPATFPAQGNYKIPFAHGMGLISDELYESLKRSCRGEYRDESFINAQCSQDLEAFQQCCSGLNPAHILEPSCGFASPKPKGSSAERRGLDERLEELHTPKLSAGSTFYCRIDGYRLAYYWINDKSVREALHVRKESTSNWIRCNYDLPFSTVISDSRPYHESLSRKGYRSLIYSGDHDMLIPYQGTQAWIRYLNYSIIDDWRPWIVRGQYAGYTRTYSNQMTFATVKGGGHTAPEYKPEECYPMFKRWISHELL